VAAAQAEGVSPGVAKTVVELTDRLSRMLKSRAVLSSRGRIGE